jgi:hypothetical protein
LVNFDSFENGNFYNLKKVILIVLLTVHVWGTLIWRSVFFLKSIDNNPKILKKNPLTPPPKLNAEKQ